MHFSNVLYGFALLQGALASPINEAGAEIETRDVEPRAPSLGKIPWPRLPSLHKKGKGKNNDGDNCPSSGGSTSQTNACSSGTPYCCTTEGNGVQTCSNSEVCTTKIICCNNNNGFQMCIGEIDFNAPVTININVYKGGKGGKGYDNQ
ncbi:hypothetical protein FSARC_10741 [Fusarium sarcochroum]|uniref:Hydrophobin n=1 Tax=Fusarium sarcochroum TaxID=1208366 RepID=A0A8H4X3B1_9HYPO|nr:hypothetical protein FSARC_10741 [Fusarium sarcochroum]